MTAPFELRLREVQPGNAPQLIALARAAFDRTWTEAYVGWKHFDNPAGAAVGRCTETGGQIVASYSNIPVRLKIGAQVVVAAQAVDAMVSSEFRRQKLFTSSPARLMRPWTRAVCRSGVCFSGAGDPHGLCKPARLRGRWTGAALC